MILKIVVILLITTTGSHQAQTDFCKCWYETKTSVMPLWKSRRFRLSFQTVVDCLDDLERDEFGFEIKIQAFNRHTQYQHVQCIKYPCMKLIPNTKYELNLNYAIEVAPACCNECYGHRHHVNTSVDIENRPTPGPLTKAVKNTPVTQRGPVIQKQHTSDVEQILLIIIPLTAAVFVLTLLAFIWVNRTAIKHRLVHRSSAPAIDQPNNREGIEEVPLIISTPEVLPVNKQHYVIASYPVPYLGNEQVKNIVLNVKELLESQHVPSVYLLKSNDMNLCDTLFSNLQECTHVIVVVTEKLAKVWRMEDGVQNTDIYFYEMKCMFNFLKGVYGREKRIYAINLISGQNYENILQEMACQFEAKMVCDFRTEESRKRDLQKLINQCLFVEDSPDICLIDAPAVNKTSIQLWSMISCEQKTDNQKQDESNQRNEVT